MSVIDEILAKFQEVCDDDEKKDGWDAFADVWNFVTEKAAQHPAPADGGDAWSCGGCGTLNTNRTCCWCGSSRPRR